MGGVTLGNLAYKVRQNSPYQQDPTPKQNVVIKKNRGVTLGEKVLATILVCGMLIAAIHIVSNQVTIYSANIEIQQIETKIQDQVKVNNELDLQVQELSTYERIWAKAQEMGLLLNENNVKVVQD